MSTVLSIGSKSLHKVVHGGNMKAETTIKDIESEKFLPRMEQDMKLMELMKKGLINASRTENVDEPYERRTSYVQLLANLF